MTDVDGFDVHHHFGSGPLDGDGSSPDYTLEEKAERHIERLTLNDLSGALLMPPPVYRNPNGIEDTRRVNDQVATVRDNHPEWFPAIAGTVEPSYGDVALEEIDRLMEDLDMDGAMWHSRFQKAAPDAPIMRDLIERVGAHDGVVVLHAIAESTINAPWRVFRVIEEFPDVQFLVLDSFSSANQIREVRHRAKDLDNAVFDTALSLFTSRTVEDFVEEVGAEQIALGTDYYAGWQLHPATEPDAIRATDLSGEEKYAILRGNAERLFDL